MRDPACDEPPGGACTRVLDRSEMKLSTFMVVSIVEKCSVVRRRRGSSVRAAPDRVLSCMRCSSSFRNSRTRTTFSEQRSGGRCWGYCCILRTRTTRRFGLYRTDFYSLQITQIIIYYRFQIKIITLCTLPVQLHYYDIYEYEYVQLLQIIQMREIR